MNLELRRCPDWHIRPAVEQDHYLRRWSDARSHPFGYALSFDGRTFAADGRPFGLRVFKLLQHHKQKRLFGYPGLPTCWQVLDLARVWVHPCLQTLRTHGLNRRGEPIEHANCVFSRMVSAALRRVQHGWIEHHPPRFPELPYHITRVISYCDREHHDGVGYRAANFERWGTTQDGSKEIYLRRLKAPRWKYLPQQAALFDELQVLVETDI